MNDSQKQDSKNLFEKYATVFNGTLGLYPHMKVSIEIEKNAKPVHSCAYTVCTKDPYGHFQKEIRPFSEYWSVFTSRNE